MSELIIKYKEADETGKISTHKNLALGTHPFECVEKRSFSSGPNCTI